MDIDHWILVILDGHKHNECELTESNSAFYQLSVRHDNTLFTLRFFFCFCGDRATSVSDEIDHEMKVRQNIRFFLRFFPPAHFDIDRPPVYLVTMGPVCLMKFTRK